MIFFKNRNDEFHTEQETHINRVINTFGKNLPKENQLDKDLRILEIGCYNGTTSYEIAKLYPEIEILAIDHLAKYIKLAEQRIKNLKTDLEINKKKSEKEKEEKYQALENIEFKIENGYELNLNEKFSMIFFMNNIIFTLEKNKLKNFKEIMLNLHNHLKFGGYLLFSANEEFIILQKLPKKYNIISENKISRNRIIVFNEIIEELNNISKK